MSSLPKKENMFIIVSTSKDFDIAGEYESIDAAIQAIRDRMGLYASSVKVEKRYVNRLGSDAAIVSFLGEKFNVRHPKPKKKLEKSPMGDNERRDVRIKKILRKSKTPEKSAYKIMHHCFDPDYGSWETEDSREILQTLERYNLCSVGLSEKHCMFVTKELASLVLAWYATCRENIFFDLRDRLYTVTKAEWCKSMFDKALKTGRYDGYYIKEIILENDGIPLCSENSGLPDSFSDGAYAIRYHFG